MTTNDLIVPQSDLPNQLLLFASQFDSRIRRITRDGVTLFSILDTFEFYGSKANPTQSWKAALKHLDKQGFDQSTQIVDCHPDGQR